MRTLKILGFFLNYPNSVMQQALPECVEILNQEALLPKETLIEIERIAHQMMNTDLIDLQESYVELFDRTPSLCLHLFEHIHGDSRARGGALADLAEIYRARQLEIIQGEFPDYLPLFLEYLALLPISEAQQNLKNIVNILALLKKRLDNRASYYALIFNALLIFAAHLPDQAMLEEALKLDDGSLNTREILDQQWQEQFAFEKSNQSCQADCGAKDIMHQYKNKNQSGEKSELL